MSTIPTTPPRAADNFRTSPSRLILVSAAVAILAALALAAASPLRKRPRPAHLNGRPGMASPQSGRADRFPIIPLNLTRFGFEPSEVRVPAGRCLIVVLNRSELEQVALQLSRQAGGKLIDENYPPGRRWERLFDLTPGEYLMRESNHPQWSCKITVTPPGNR